MNLTGQILNKLILEVLEESEYYDKHKDIDTDYATQAMELGQSMSDDGSRDRSEQVETYVRLKVDKEIKKELIKQSEWAVRELTDEARGVMGYAKGDDADEWDRKETENLRKMYARHLKGGMDAALAFDGTQESVDAWTNTMIKIEKKLYDNKDPAMHYLGSIIPEHLHIGKPFFQSYDLLDDPDWGGNYQKSVELQTAVKEAEDFYRPGIMKMVLKAQSAETGMDLGQMFGLNESLGDMFRSDVEYANTAIETLISAGLIPEPKHIWPKWNGIYISFNSPEELQQLIDILEEEGVKEQVGSKDARPMYFKSINLMNPKQASTALTLKI